MSLQSTRDSIAEINAEKLKATTLAAGAAAASTNLATVTDPVTGGALLGADGRSQPLLVLQGTEDFAYRFSTVTGDAAVVAVDIVVPANQQEYVRPVAQTGRTWISVIRAGSSDSVVKVFRSAAAK